jgi:DNA-directed RNA polymerase specialized sigma24 family protein
MIDSEFAGQLNAGIDLLWRVGLLLTGDPAQAETLVERVCAEAWEIRGTVPLDGVQLWLLGLAVSVWRAASTEPAPGAPPFLEASIGEAYELTRAAGYQLEDDPAADLAARMDRDDVWRATQRLPLDQRAALALSLGAGLTQLEISRALRAPRQSVRQWLQQGRAGLKVALWEGRGVKCGG